MASCGKERGATMLPVSPAVVAALCPTEISGATIMDAAVPAAVNVVWSWEEWRSVDIFVIRSC
jgi:hypothetical protein